MNEDRYLNIKNAANYQIFTFTSEGRHGTLTKVVRFDELSTKENTYNLALGTILPDGKIDFVGTTNNGDRNKILATVAAIIYIFTDKHLGKDIYITGSDNRRTLLYQRAIIYAHDELTLSFNIYGDVSQDNEISKFETFEKTKSYSGFLIKRK